MKVKIPYELHDKIMFFVHKSSIEISMMARIKKEKDTFILTNVYLLDQENTATSTDIDATALGKLMYESREDEGFLNCWIHSHVNMGVFWSGTDKDTIKEFGSNGFLLSLVFNKKGEVRAHYFQGEQGADSPLPWLEIDDIPVEITYPTVKGRKDWEKEYREKCRTKTYNQSTLPMPGKHHTTTFPNSNFGGKSGGKLKEQATLATEREHGMINPKNINQRWHTNQYGKGSWMNYKKFVRNNAWYDSLNVLDQLDGARNAWIKIYQRDKGEMPLDDYAVNDFYMEVKKMSPMDFYEEVV